MQRIVGPLLGIILFLEVAAAIANRTMIGSLGNANAANIDTLIVGTGNEVWMPPSWLRDRLRKVSVVIDAMQTGPAIR